MRTEANVVYDGPEVCGACAHWCALPWLAGRGKRCDGEKVWNGEECAYGGRFRPREEEYDNEQEC